MVCFFCRDPNVDLIVHDACKSPTAGWFESKTLCPKCGKCEKCDHDELIKMVRLQNYAIMKVSKRRFSIVRVTQRIGIHFVSPGFYLGPHLAMEVVEGCEKLNYEVANQRLADVLYNPTSEWR